jgi:hypothetical protein
MRRRHERRWRALAAWKSRRTTLDGAREAADLDASASAWPGRSAEIDKLAPGAGRVGRARCRTQQARARAGADEGARGALDAIPKPT